MAWKSALVIFAGGGLGAVARWGVSLWTAARIGESFPWGTFIANTTGCLLIGLIASLTGPDSRFVLSPVARQFLMIGVLGGYTTFSSFSLQTLLLVQERQWAYAGMNVGLSLFCCLAGVWLGFVLGETLNR